MGFEKIARKNVCFFTDRSIKIVDLVLQENNDFYIVFAIGFFVGIVQEDMIRKTDAVLIIDVCVATSSSNY